MLKSSKHYQVVGIPYAALISVIFGLMVVSFPVGAYLVFNSEIGNEINFDYPLKGFDFILGGISYAIPFEFELGDAFILVWCTFLVLFSVSLFGPKKNFLSALFSIMSTGKTQSESNYLVSAIKWFAILIVVSGIINFAQESVGIFIEPPASSNRLVQFYQISLAPIVEEIGFRAMLIGIPLFALYYGKTSGRSFFKSLWHPYKNLHVYDYKKVYTIIIVVGVFFGAAHVISGEPWSIGKFSQAAASGIILGWVYFRYGLLPSILIHWATNYFIISYVFFIADVNQIIVENAFSHSLINTFEILFVLTGAMSIFFVARNFLGIRKKRTFENF